MKLEDLYFTAYRTKNELLEIYAIPKGDYIKRELSRLDEAWEFEINVGEGFFIGTITVKDGNRFVKRSAMLRKKDMEAFGGENKLLVRTAIEVGIGEEIYGKKIYSEFYKTKEFEHKTHKVKKTKIVDDEGDMIDVWFLEPTQEIIQRMIAENEVYLEKKQ